jgi:beta-galactosidase
VKLQVSLHDLPEGRRPRLWLGTIYHPEHWPEERWPEDIRLMTEAGLNVVWMADCPWAALEPIAGVYDFGWLARAIELLAESGISTVLGSSNLTPPAWLLRQSPDPAQALPEESASLDFSGESHTHAADVEASVMRLVGEMAKRFGPNPNVIGWQLGNRIALTHGQHDPRPAIDTHGCLTHGRKRFLRRQIELLRPHVGAGVWITGSPTTWQDDHDSYALSEDVDVDSVPFKIGGGRSDYLRTNSLQLLAWGLKRRGFWTVAPPETEQRSMSARSTLHKEEAQVVAWQAVAHGAKGLAPWQWRPAPDGESQHLITLVDQSGQPRPYYEEIKLLGLEFTALSTYLADSTTARARVAILNSPDSRWAIEAERQFTGLDFLEHLEHWYRPLLARNVAVDIIPADANLDQYKLVIAPTLSVLSEKIVNSLKDLVRHSGHLVLALRTGVRDEHNAILPLRQPGPLSTLAGVEVEDCYPLDEPVPVKGNWFEGVARHWAERIRILDPNKAVKIARYGVCNGWLDNEIAITVCAQGTGLTYTIGVYLDVPAQQAMVDHFLQNAGLQRVDTPPGVEICTRVSPIGEQIYVIINHERTPATITLPSPAHNPLTGQPVSGAFRLAPYGVAVLLKSKTIQPASAP